MSPTFLRSPSFMLAAESVTEGHPDKLCDQISDGVVDAILAKDPYARVACETAVTTGLVLVTGEITCECYVEIPEVVRNVIRDAGYIEPAYGFDYRTCGVIVSLKQQSGDIAAGVNQSMEIRSGTSKDELLEQSKKVLPDLIISGLKLTDWNDATGMEVLNFALTNNIPMVLDFSQVPNDGLKRILEAKNTSLFELKPTRLQDIIEEEQV